MPSTYRELAARLVLANGGYFDGSCTYPLEFNVKVRRKPSLEDLNARVAKDFSRDARWLDDKDVRKRVQRRFDVDARWSEALCLAQLDVMSHADYRTVSPEIGKAWGLESLPYFDASFDFVGTTGGHAVVTSFEGFDFAHWSAHALSDAILAGKVGSNRWCQALAAMISEWTELLSQEAANEEVAYHLTALYAEVIQRTATHLPSSMRKPAVSAVHHFA